jgi:hypothetical protein
MENSCNVKHSTVPFKMIRPGRFKSQVPNPRFER